MLNKEKIMMVFDWYEVTLAALIDLWQGFVVFIPKLIGALVIFLIGWFIAVIIGKVITEVLKRIKFNRIFDKGDMKDALEKADFKIDASGFIGAIFKWILVIVFLVAAVEVLGLPQFADFLTKVLAYLPNVIVAALIFVVAVIIADISEKIVRAAVESTKIGYSNIAGIIVRWSIWIFAILAILFQLGIARELIQIVLSGIVGLLVIGGGLAFGLGGKDAAAEIIQNLRNKLQR